MNRSSLAKMKATRIATIAIAASLALMATHLQTASGSNALTEFRSQTSKPLVKNEAFPFSQTAPAFPTQVPDYVLQEQKRPDPIRLFRGDGWVVPIKQFDPERGGTATMSCQPMYWVLRWRSNNPDVTVRASAGLTDAGEFTKIRPTTQGGTGLMEGQSCVAPAFKFGRGLRGNQANLVDVNFEYQIWKSQPKI
jgi:hypothetical protein